MKNLLVLLLVCLGLTAKSQTYNPSVAGVPINKALAPAQASSTDSRSLFYDATNFVYRAYVSTNEVISYLNLAKYRTGQFDIVVNTGGSLSNGVITGGTNAVYFFKDGTADANLVLKNTITSVNGQVGVVVSKNADSIKNVKVDTGSAARHNYILAFDSTLRKWYLAAPATGTALTEGTGISIASGIVSALNTTALWNANQIRGRSVSSATPATNNIMKWSGSSWNYSKDLSGVDTGYISNDTLYLITVTDTVRVLHMVSKTYVDAAIAAIPLNPSVNTDQTLHGNGTVGSVLGADTTNWIATTYQINKANARIDSINTTHTGIDTVAHDATMSGQGTLATPLKNDSTLMATRSWVQSTYTAPSGAETKVISSATVSVSGTGTTLDPYIPTAIGSATANPFRALSLYDYGGVADAVVPATGSIATGTNNTPKLLAMYTAALPGQWIVVPAGEWLFSTALDTIKTKRINLLVLGNTHHNGANFIVMAAGSGAYKHHRIVHLGTATGRENMPSHSKSGAVRSSPTWSTFTGAFVTIYNINEVYVEFQKVEGFYYGIDIVGSNGAGAQENYITGGWLYKCAVDISLRSLDGQSYVDKNEFFIRRLSGGLAINIDGFSGTAPNGEIFNGAFRSNKIHALIEQVDSMAVGNGDITDMLFDVTIENGVNTGVLGADPIKMRIAAPNYVRSPKWAGQGILSAERMGTGSTGSMGVDGTVKMAIWGNSSSTYYGSEAILDGSGNVVIQCKSTVSNATRAAAPGYVKFLNFGEPETEVTITAATYTVASGVRYVYYNNAAGTLTLPTASSFPTRNITVINTNTSNALSVANVASGFQTSLSNNKAITYRSNGVSWYPVTDAIPIPIAPSQINATGTAGDVFTTTGTAGGGSFGENHAGYLRYSVTTTAATGTTLAAVTLPASKGMELDVIIIGYRTADNTVYRTHLQKGYSTTGVASAIKGSATISSYTSDFTPAVFTEQAGGTLTYTITVSSVATETIQWSCWIKVRPTFTSS